MEGWESWWFYILEGTLDYSILNVIFTWFSPSGFPGRLEYFFPEKRGGGWGERNLLFSTPFSVNEPEFEIFLWSTHSILISCGHESNLIWWPISFFFFFMVRSYHNLVWRSMQVAWKKVSAESVLSSSKIFWSQMRKKIVCQQHFLEEREGVFFQ